MSGEVSVRGGAYSVEADVDALIALSSRLAYAGRSVGEGMVLGLRSLIEPSGVAAAALDPFGAGKVALEVAAAEVLGVRAVALCEAVAMALAGAAAAYRRGDDLEARLGPNLTALERLPNALMHAAPGIAEASLGGHPGRIKDALTTAIGHDSQLGGLAVLAIAMPVTSGFANPLGRGAASGQVLEAMLAGRLYADGKPAISRRAHAVAEDAAAPRGLGDLVNGLTVLDKQAEGGDVDVRRVVTTGTDGTVKHAVIVDITGTRDWTLSPGPAARRTNVADVGTNLRAFANGTTTYERGVLQALRASGVRSDEPIMVVGHSQGGLIAAQLARHTAASGEFRVTHVVTAGSPVGLVDDLPRSVQVLSLENRGDFVPQLDTADNQRRSNRITVTVNRGPSSALARHGLEAAYLPGARDTDASGDPSVAAWMHGAHDFLQGDAVKTDVYRVTRRP
jgi:hypothetical protein